MSIKDRLLNSSLTEVDRDREEWRDTKSHADITLDSDVLRRRHRSIVDGSLDSECTLRQSMCAVEESDVVQFFASSRREKTKLDISKSCVTFIFRRSDVFFETCMSMFALSLSLLARDSIISKQIPRKERMTEKK